MLKPKSWFTLGHTTYLLTPGGIYPSHISPLKTSQPLDAQRGSRKGGRVYTPFLAQKDIISLGIIHY